MLVSNIKKWMQQHCGRLSPPKEAISYPSLSTHHLSSSSSSSWHSSTLSTNYFTLSEEPLDLRVDGKCRDKDLPEVNSASRLFCSLIVANAAYGTLIKRYKEESTNCDVSSEESSDGSEDLPSTNCFEIGEKSRGGKEGGGKAARIHYRPEQLGSREMVQVMLRNKDPELKYVNDGDAVVNPFAVDRKTQLADLMRMFCKLCSVAEYWFV
ncbi:unnamed protein product [Taenia asiatica]|uniref:Pecanex-like protein n=1 Tax=Taenia asiatica TaxID=60517 RepID=A0A0R3WBJ1_TAEAS|nr:unnamed protein product [Taenia asiatica]